MHEPRYNRSHSTRSVLTVFCVLRSVFCVLCFACWVQMSEFLDLVNQPVIDVGAVARQQWLAERAKAEKAEEKLKQQVRPLD